MNIFPLTEFEKYCKNSYESGNKAYLEKPMSYSEFESLVGNVELLYLHNEIFHETITTNSPGHTIKDIDIDGEQIEVVLHSRFSYPILHNHAYIELIYIMSGECTHFVENHTFNMKAGDVCILAPDAMHALSVKDENTIAINIMMSKSMFDVAFLKIVKGGSVISQFLEDVLYNKQVSPYILFPTDNDCIINDLVLNIYNERIHKDYLFNESVILLVKQLFIRLIRKYELSAIVSNPMNNAHASNVVALMVYININYRSVTLKQAAKFFGYNENYLGKIVQRYTGKNFKALISGIQMENAKKLLQETSLSITEVGNEVGCYDTSHFNRKFKATYGITPNTFKKQLN